MVAKKSLALALVLVPFLGLILHPLPMCFDCEPDPYLLSDPHYKLASRMFLVWLVGASFLAGAARVAGFLLVPLGIALADLATQHLGGVPWWSVRTVDGPVVLVFDLVGGLAAAVAGVLANALWAKLTRRRQGVS